MSPVTLITGAVLLPATIRATCCGAATLQPGAQLAGRRNS